MRFTSLGLQMRGAVESRRLIELDGVNAGRVVGVAWMISGVMAGLAGVLLAPIYGELQFSDYAALMVAAFAAAAWAVLRSMPIAALVAVLMGVVATTLQGYLPVSSVWSSAVLTSLPFIVLVAALLIVPGLRTLDSTKDPLSSVDPPTPPSAATIRAPQLEKFASCGLVRAPGRLRGIDADLAAQHLGERLQRRPGVLDGLLVHYPDHWHGGPALAGPGHPGRGRSVHRRPVGQSFRPELPTGWIGRRGGRRPRGGGAGLRLGQAPPAWASPSSPLPPRCSSTTPCSRS